MRVTLQQCGSIQNIEKCNRSSEWIAYQAGRSLACEHRVSKSCSKAVVWTIYPDLSGLNLSPHRKPSFAPSLHIHLHYPLFTFQQMPKASNLGSCSSQLKGSPDGRWDTEGESSAPKTYELMIVASSAQVDSLLSCVAVMLCQGESRGEDCGKFWNCYQVYQSSFGKLRRFSSLSFGSTAVMSSWKVWAAGLIYGCGAVAWPKGTGCWAFFWSQTKTIYDAIWTIYDGLLLIG